MSDGNQPADLPLPENNITAEPFFTGHEPRECGEHRTVGTHRAWCFDCTEWCYPAEGCKGCRIAAAEAAADVLRAQGAAAERERLLEALREFLLQYVGMVEQRYTWNGEKHVSYASGPIAFPDALVDTFALVDTPDADLLAGDAP